MDRLGQSKHHFTEPEEMFDIELFREDPRIFYSVSEKLLQCMSGVGTSPTFTHKFIAALASMNKLQRVYTQNIDGLEMLAGLQPGPTLVHCHGCIATASCIQCGAQVPTAELLPVIREHQVPTCSRCKGIDGAWIKPDITFFKERLPRGLAHAMARDVRQADMVIVMGTSLTVKPAGWLPLWVPAHVPCLLINRDPVNTCGSFSLQLLGDCDVIIGSMLERLYRTPYLPSIHVVENLLPACRRRGARQCAEAPCLPALPDDDADQPVLVQGSQAGADTGLRGSNRHARRQSLHAMADLCRFELEDHCTTMLRTTPARASAVPASVWNSKEAVRELSLSTLVTEISTAASVLEGLVKLRTAFGDAIQPAETGPSYSALHVLAQLAPVPHGVLHPTRPGVYRWISVDPPGSTV